MYNHALNEIFQNKEALQRLPQFVERLMPLKAWEFKQSALFFTKSKYPVTIYDSEKCRVKFLLDRDRYGRNSMFVTYGRLHAPNDEGIMRWNENECRCWHRVNMALRFLDDISLCQVVEKRIELPQIVEEFKLSELAKSAHDAAERSLFLHASIWKQYGNRLFALYDLRHPDLWQRLIHFTEEYHKKINFQIDTTPPEYKIC